MLQQEVDREFGYTPRILRCRKPQCRTSPWQFLCRILPVLSWLPKYSVRQNLVSDVIAGITVGIMHIPQGLAYSILAGVPAINGLYTSLFPTLVYFIFGTSRHISMGTFSIAALMVGGVRFRFVPEEQVDDMLTEQGLDPLRVVTALTLTTGMFQLLMGLLRMGFLVVLMSEPVIGGFTTGGAIMVFTAQLDKIFGVKLARYANAGKLYFTYRDLILSMPTVNVASLIISGITILIVTLVKLYASPPFQRKFRMPIPIDLIMIIIVTGISYAMDLKTNYSVRVVGKIPASLLFDAITIAIVTFSITMSMVKIFAKRNGYRTDANQELIAVGMQNVVTSFLYCFTSSGTMARSSVNENAGAKTQISCFLGSFVVLVVILWVGPYLEDLPVCVLSSIIVVALKGMFLQFRELCVLWRQSRIDFSVWLLSFLATVILDVAYGLLISVLAAILSSLLRQHWPYSSTLGEGKFTDCERSLVLDSARYSKTTAFNNDRITVFRFDSPLSFVNCELFRKRILKQLEKYCDTTDSTKAKDSNENELTKMDSNANPTASTEMSKPTLIVDCRSIAYGDVMGAKTMGRVHAEAAKQNVEVVLADCSDDFRSILQACSITATVSEPTKMRVFYSVQDAVLWAQSRDEQISED